VAFESEDPHLAVILALGVNTTVQEELIVKDHHSRATQGWRYFALGLGVGQVKSQGHSAFSLVSRIGSSVGRKDTKLAQDLSRVDTTIEKQ